MTADIAGPMSIHLCKSACVKESFYLSGLMDGGQCKCCNSTIYKTAFCQGCCNVPCKGETNQKCGGSEAVDIYETVEDERYLGCYKDQLRKRIFPKLLLKTESLITVEKCVNRCRTEGFTFAGIEYQTQCFCGKAGDDYKVHGHCNTDASCSCDYLCLGESQERCGGYKSVSVYKTDCGRGTYGFNCARKCNCHNGEDCDKQTGVCLNKASDTVSIATGPRYVTRENVIAGCEDGAFGRNCEHECHCRNGLPCDKTNGTCPKGGCAAGYNQMDKTCQTLCGRGTYGLNCGQRCNCHNGEDCDKQTGVCSNKTLNTVPMATVSPRYVTSENVIAGCEDGTFGRNCEHKCHCRNGLPCNKMVGTCPKGGCAPGYKQIDRTCQALCGPGTFGLDCSKKCNCHGSEDCNKESGMCPSEMCKMGYSFRLDPTCQTECRNGFFGQNCANNCNCLHGFPCDKTSGACPDHLCQPGYRNSDITCQTSCDEGTYGPNCSMLCNCYNGDRCDKEFGTCSNKVCQPGYDYTKNPTCQTECNDGRFGLSCAFECHCSGSEVCNKITGICPNKMCAAGYQNTDQTCQTHCDPGTFGKGCSQICKCHMKEECIKETGICSSGLCQPGFDFNLDPTCQTECVNGKFGFHCAHSCNCRDSVPCNKLTGSCASGLCAPGYNNTDKTCHTECKPPKSPCKMGENCIEVNGCLKATEQTTTETISTIKPVHVNIILNNSAPVADKADSITKTVSATKPIPDTIKPMQINNIFSNTSDHAKDTQIVSTTETVPVKKPTFEIVSTIEPVKVNVVLDPSASVAVTKTVKTTETVPAEKQTVSAIEPVQVNTILKPSGTVSTIEPVPVNTIIKPSEPFTNTKTISTTMTDPVTILKPSEPVSDTKTVSTHNVPVTESASETVITVKTVSIETATAAETLSMTKTVPVTKLTAAEMLSTTKTAVPVTKLTSETSTTKPVSITVPVAAPERKDRLFIAVTASLIGMLLLTIVFLSCKGADPDLNLDEEDSLLLDNDGDKRKYRAKSCHLYRDHSSE